MLDSTGASGFLPTVTFDGSSGVFTSAHRINTLGSIGITGFYEADFSNAVTTIDLSAFAFDTNVVVATINGVTTINNDAFYGCTALRSITLDTSVNTTTMKYLLTSIGNRALYGCTSLRNLHIPDTVKQIPDYLCFGCTNLEIAVIGYGCAPRDANDNYIVDASINQFAFAACPKLSFFIIPETVGYVGNSAFFNNPLLSYVAVLGKPTFVGTTVFGGTTLNTAAARYIYDICQNLTSVVPSNSTKNQYYEYEFAASSGTSITGADVLARFNGLSPTPTWVKVKLKGTGTGSVVTLGSAATPAFRAFEMNGANYSKVIGFSFPNSLTTSFYGAFENWNSAAGPVVCNVAAHYMPNSFTSTTPDVNGNSVTFHLSTDALMISSQTRQIVFQSGPNKVQLGLSTFLRNSARAIIIYDTASTHATNTLKGIPSTCFQNCFYLQFCNFLQKNAYSTFNRINANAFQSTFMSGYAGSGTHYVYIPKQIQGTGFSNCFLSTNTNIVFTVYDKYLDGIAGNGIDGLGTNSAGSGSYITTAGLGIVAANATAHIICNWYNTNGLLSGTFNAFGYNYHLLFHPFINTIPNRFAGNANLKTIAISDTITDINTFDFSGCTGLTRVNVSPSSNLTFVGASAFSGCTALTTLFIPNSLRGINASTFSRCTSLASVTYGNNPGIKYIGDLAFYDTVKTLANIFIPSSVVFVGNRVFITSTASNLNILSTVTFGAGSRLKSIDYQCFGLGNNNYLMAAQYLRDLVLPNSIRYLGPTNPFNSSPFQSTHTLGHSANFVVPSSLELIPWALLYADTGTVDISNVYFPRSITNVVGPRIHNGYSLSGGLIGAEFNLSKAGSLIYLPSELSTYTSTVYAGTTFPFPNFSGTNRARSYYRTVSFTTNPLISLNLSGTVANTTNAATTTQIHADIKEGVIVIGGGTTSIDMSGSIDGSRNLISVNIPSTVTTISANAFNGCNALVYVTFSENSHLTTIGNSAFSGCTMIHDIKLPDTLTTIGQNAFNGCANLASISIPYNVTSIGTGAFAGAFVRPKLVKQIGQDIDGEAASDQSGRSVSLNSDGTIMAIGSHLNDGTGADAGRVRVFKYNGSNWTQLGGDIDGEAAGDQFGFLVSLSTDGTTLAIGANANDGTSGLSTDSRGHVRIYKYDPTKLTSVTDQSSTDFGPIGWRRLGPDIDGEAAGDGCGVSVSINSDGTIVAMGAVDNDGTALNAGHARVYKYQTIADATWANYTVNSFSYANKPVVVNGGDANPVANKFYWVQLGGDIDGEAAGDGYGFSVSISSDGTTLAIGSPYNDATGNNAGHARVYKYQTIADATWSNYTVNSFTYANKPIVVNGGDANPVSGKFYWVQLGGDMDGEAANDQSAIFVSLSKDGTTLAISGQTNDGTTGNVSDNRGHARIYQYDPTKTTSVTDQNNDNFGPIGWRRLGQDIDGEATLDRSGWNVSLSKTVANGIIVAIGAYLNDGTPVAADRGQVRIYQYDPTKTTTSTDQYSYDCGPVGWRRLDQDIDGEAGNDQSGYSVSISADGSTFAVGAMLNDGTPVGADRGHVRAYQLINPCTVRLHQKLYNDISGSFSTYFPGISPASIQVVPALTLTNTLNPAKLTISQINNIYIRYRQSQLGGCTRVTVSASSGGVLTAADITTALSTSSGLVHLDFGTNVTDISQNACKNNTRIYSVAFSKTVTSIGFDSFNGCSNLNYLSFHPDSTFTSIGQGAFLGNNIIDLALPDSLTSISAWSFQNSNRLTSVCIPKNVNDLSANAFYNCPKLTSVALPSSLALATYGTGTYFNINGSSTTGITFSSYSTSGAIAHFKLSDYSMPSGIVQNVVDSAVTYIDHRAYAYYPEIALYAVTTNKQTVTGGPYTYPANNVQTPIMPATIWLNGVSVVSNSIFPIYRSVPDLNVFSLSNTTTDWPDNQDDYYVLMPGYSICIYNNLYDEENLFTDSPTYRYYDHEFGIFPLNINGTGVINTTSSILIMFAGRILTKYFLN
jgi:hypothetical protein